MEFLTKYSVRRKIIVVLSGIASLAVLTASLIFSWQIISSYKASYRHELSLRATIIGANCKAALTFSLPDDARTVLTSLQADPSIIAARIRDTSGRLFACVGEGCQEGDGNNGQESLIVREKITLDGRVLGEVELVDDMRHIHAFQNKVVLNLIMILAGVLVCSVFLARRLSIVITSPLQELAFLAGTIAKEQNYTLRATVHSQDEVGTLAEAFNTMLAQIDHKTRDLISSERRFRTLVDQAVDAFFLHDENGRFVDVNQTACDALNYSREELLALSVADVDGEATPPSHELSQFWHYAEPGAELTLTSHHKRRDGSLFPVEVRLGILEIEGSRYIMAMARDITERKRAEEERAEMETRLRQSQKMESIGTLAGGIAHDFNNILSAIFGYTELALDEQDPEKRKQDLNQVRLASERAKELVKQILTFSRRTEQERQPLQVSMVIKEAMKLLRSSIPTTIEIRQDVHSNATVLADPTQIHQIIMNLCTNAYHAMRESGGILAVSLGEIEIQEEDEGYGELAPGKYLKLEVGDTGGGIPPEMQEKIFEPYFTTKKIGEGTGLGLAVVHGIVKSNHGHITVYSELGKGTTFHVYLPVVEKRAVDLPVREANVNLAGHGERILFVDDEVQIREFATKLFPLYGYQVTTFTHGVQALEEFQYHSDQYDLVITDMTMPYMTGAELAQKILSIRPDIPIILCTGQSELVNREKALAMGICDYLNKPVVKYDFLVAIRKALKK